MPWSFPARTSCCRDWHTGGAILPCSLGGGLLGAPGPQAAAPQGIHTGYGGEEPRLATTSGTSSAWTPMATVADLRSVPAAHECQGPQAGPMGRKWIRPDREALPGKWSKRRSEHPGCPGSTQLRRGEVQGGFPLQRFPTRAWGASCCLSLFWLAGTLPDPAWCWPPPAFTSTPGRRAGWVTAYCTNLFEEKLGSKKPAPTQSPPAVSHSLPQCSWHRS